MNNFVITIARGFGSGGKEIGNKLSEALGIPCYDTRLIGMLEEYSGLNRSLFANVDEKLSGPNLLKLLKGFSGTEYIVSPMEKEFVSDENLYQMQVNLIRELANSNSCIIVGKCANFVLKDHKNVLSIYVEAPREVCVKNIIEKLAISTDEAHKLITKTDRYRSNYYRYYTRGEDWTNPTAYDLTLNTGRINTDRCTQLILKALEIKELKK
ncbi:MAG: cytidylate kinase-like family protein [Clostridia bacterium]